MEFVSAYTGYYRFTKIGPTFIMLVKNYKNRIVLDTFTVLHLIRGDIIQIDPRNGPFEMYIEHFNTPPKTISCLI